jgi:hypothetical protein
MIDSARIRPAARAAALLALGLAVALPALGLTVALPTNAHAVFGIEPYVASRQLVGDARDLFESGVAKGIALSLVLPGLPIRPRASIDWCSHDSKAEEGDDLELDGTVLGADVIFELGAGLTAPYLLAGIGVSNLDGRPSRDEVEEAYDSGAAFLRAGAGLRAGLGRKLAVTGEASYVRAGKGNDLIDGELGNLAFIDLRLGALVTF